MSFEHDTRTAPAYWAPMLFNGDASGMDDADAYACAQWEDQLAEEGWRITGTVNAEPFFTHWTDALPIACDAYAYTLLREI